MATKTITITKVGETPSKPIQKETHIDKKSGKTMKTFPKSILKTIKQPKSILRGVPNPSKPPPLRKNMEKHTIRLITDKGLRRHRKTLRRKIAGMSNEKVKELVSKNGLLKNPNTPPEIMREMLEGGAMAGFVSFN